MTEQVKAAERPSEGEIRAELDRLLADGDLRASERQRRFLRYVTLATLEGRAHEVKAYSIAVDVFERPTTFDPSDPIVRIEATRLRMAMRRYYESYGDRTPIRITLPKGSYAPTFEYVDGTPEADSSPAYLVPAERLPSRHAGSFRRAVRGRWLLAALTALAAIGIVEISRDVLQAPAPRFSERPAVSVEVHPASDALAGEARQFHDRLVADLARFQTLHVTAQADAGSPPAAGSDARISRYRLVFRYDGTESARAVSWWIVSSSNEVLQSGQQAGNPDAGAAVADRLADRVSSRLAGYRGAIPAIETRVELDDPTLGAGCVQRALFALVERLDMAEIAAGRSCLEATVAALPGNADARAVLAYTLVSTNPFATPPADLQGALDIAESATSLAPESNRSWAALMVALYHNRQVDRAIEAGRRAVALNPNEAAITAYLGWMLFATGRWEDGVRLAREGVETDPLSFYDSGATLVLDAYRRGAYEEVVGDPSRSYRQPYMVLLAQIAALGELGRPEASAGLVDALRKWRPRFEQTFDEDMAARSIAPELAEKLRHGLVLAGLQVAS